MDGQVSHESTPENNPSSQKNRSSLAIIIGVILILLVGLFLLNSTQGNKGISLINSTPKETSNPSEYIGLGYSLLHPKDWYFETFDSKHFPNLVGPDTNNSGPSRQAIFQNQPFSSMETKRSIARESVIGGIRIDTIGSLFGLQWATISETEFLDKQSPFWKKDNDPISTFSDAHETTIAGKRAMVQTSHEKNNKNPDFNSNNSFRNYYVFLGSGKIINIYLGYDETNPNKELILKTFESILSTLKLT